MSDKKKIKPINIIISFLMLVAIPAFFVGGVYFIGGIGAALIAAAIVTFLIVCMLAYAYSTKEQEEKEQGEQMNG